MILMTPADQKEFVAGNWDRFASLAWKGYQAEGRGFLYFDVDLMQAALGTEERKQVGAYLGVKTVQRAGATWPPGVQEVIAKYDPRQEVVFVFRRSTSDGDESVSTYRLAALPPPWEAAQPTTLQ